MIVGIDASRSFVREATGTENYARELTRSLVELAPEVSFRLYTRGEEVHEFARRDNVQIRAIPFPRLWSLVRLSAELLRRGPDALFVPAHVLPPAHHKASFVTVHDLGYLFFPQAHRLVDRLYLDLSTRWNAAAARVVFADSKATRRDLQMRYGIAAEQVVVAYPGLDEGFQPQPNGAVEHVRAKYGLDHPYILSVGTLHPRKNYARLLSAFGRINRQLRLVIVGKRGWLYQDFVKMTARPELEGRVKLLDYVPRSDLPSLYAGALLCAYPSLYEGFGFPVIEAMACGAPVVCSNTSSLPEVGGDAAIYCEPENTDSIAAALESAMGDTSGRADRIARGIAQAACFSWRACAQIVMSEIRKGVGNG